MTRGPTPERHSVVCVHYRTPGRLLGGLHIMLLKHPAELRDQLPLTRKVGCLGANNNSAPLAGSVYSPTLKAKLYLAEN